VINTHWRAEEYSRAFPEAKYREVETRVRHESPEVLETAGALKTRGPAPRRPILVYNGDIFCTLPWSRRCARIAMRERSYPGSQVIRRTAPGHFRLKPAGVCSTLAAEFIRPANLLFFFSGIYLNREPGSSCARIPAAVKISVVPIFCEIDSCRRETRPLEFVIDEGAWFDLGTREQILAVHRHLG
jgi:mannose-1-phosphate guanylyltransferase